jgi:hypothetical protein
MPDNTMPFGAVFFIFFVSGLCQLVGILPWVTLVVVLHVPRLQQTRSRLTRRIDSTGGASKNMGQIKRSKQICQPGIYLRHKIQGNQTAMRAIQLIDQFPGCNGHPTTNANDALLIILILLILTMHYSCVTHVSPRA